MDKNRTSPNNIEGEQILDSVSGYVSALHVASPVSNNISVKIVDGSNRTILEDGRLTYGIDISPGDKLLKVLELALVHNRIVKITKHIHEGTHYIDNIGLVRE
ncbi:hypothetical protein [Xenorhabdus sp. KJ12.1]|uniref:hypothetical protein n=1 Tax=Xenorhabdus sp. KJ12.1 TaxID=1851571 RepID=UPI000C03920A|nr:hypothetical protein [Xenorhabdus sp. KJ12.1]PHM70275.1 hypothetical protein Xekj_01902 [Xenorhabdus sp. KJ12.1]